MATENEAKTFEKNVIEVAIKLTILGILLFATVRIIQPFIVPVAWGGIIAIAAEPLISKLAEKFGVHRKMAAILFAVVVIAALIIPSVMLVSTSIETIQTVADKIENDTLKIPPPPAGVQDWPLIGKSAHKTWSLVSGNLELALEKYEPQLKNFITFILGKIRDWGKVLFMFIISVAIAAALLVTAERGEKAATKIISRFAGERGPKLAKLSTATIRGVMQGVIGVAFIQSILAVIGMVIVGVPAAGLWAGIVLVLAVIQMPPILILGPIAAWVFTFTDTLPAVLFLIWALLVSGCDGILKPILMGRGVDAPMLVILIGALGGMMASGIIGLFVGAVIVSISYTLFMAWVENEESVADQEGKGEGK